MEFAFEFIFQIFGELLLQLLFEALMELGLHGAADTVKRPKNPALSAVGFAIWGAIAGGISLLIFPTSHIHDPTLRIVNLVLTPLALGFAMMLVGKIRSKKGQNLVRLDQFGYAFTFAFVMALVRFMWAA